MSLPSFKGIALKLASNPARFLDDEAFAIRDWVGRAQPQPGLRLFERVENEEILPGVDVGLVLNPLDDSALPASASAPAPGASHASVEGEQAAAESAAPKRAETLRRTEWKERARERARGASNAKAAGVAVVQPVNLLVILQRYSGLNVSVWRSAPDSSKRTASSTLAGDEEHVRTGQSGEDPKMGAGREGGEVVALQASGTRPKAAALREQASRVSYQELLSKFRERSAQRLVEWVSKGEGERKGARKFEGGRSSRFVDAGGDRNAGGKTAARAEGRGDKRLEQGLSAAPQTTTVAQSRSRTPQPQTERGGDGKAVSSRRENSLSAPGGYEAGDACRAGKVRLDETVRDVVERLVASEERRAREHGSGSTAQSLERIVEKLVDIELKISSPPEPSKETERGDAGSLRWLDDNDLAERLQGILRRQARHRGIDLT